MTRHRPTLPPVTDAHRRAAFAAMRWAGWTLDQALADPVRRRIVECRAHQLRTLEHRAAAQAQRRSVVRPPLPAAKHLQHTAARDGKRAAAGDRDD